MKLLKSLFLEDWRLKLLSIVIALFLWAWVRVSDTAPFIVSKEIQVINGNPEYTYKLDAKRVRIKLSLPQRTKLNDVAEDIRAFVDVKGLGEGEYVSEVKVETRFKLFARIEELEPEYVKVFIVKKPPRGQ